MNIVKDKGELVSNDIYKIIKGKNDLDINGVNVRKFNNYINKKRQNKTYLLDYSTVTAFAKFLGWSTFLPNINAIWYDSNCKGIVVTNGESVSGVLGTSII